MTALPVLLCSRAPTRICCRFQGIFGDGSGRAGRRGRGCRALEDVLSLTGKRGGLCSQHGAARGMHAVRRCTVRALLRPHQRVRRGWRRGRSQQEPIEHAAARAGASLCERQTQFPLLVPAEELWPESGLKKPIREVTAPPLCPDHKPGESRMTGQDRCPAVMVSRNPKPILLSRRPDDLGCHVRQWKGLLTTCNPAPRPRRRSSKRGWGRPDLPRRHHQRSACRYQTIPVLLSKCLFIPK